jgi:hypothetical protein
MGEGGWELLAGLLGASTEITAGVRLEEWQCLPSPDSELCFQLVRAFYSQEAAVHACLMARLKNFDDDHVFSMNIFSGGEHLRKVSRATSHSDVPTKPADRKPTLRTVGTVLGDKKSQVVAEKTHQGQKVGTRAAIAGHPEAGAKRP